MASTFEEIRGVAPDWSNVAYHWAASIQAACDTLSRMPDDLMNSITVTGKLEDRRHEIDLLTELSHQLASENGLQVSIDAAEGFVARFSRSDHPRA